MRDDDRNALLLAVAMQLLKHMSRIGPVVERSDADDLAAARLVHRGQAAQAHLFAADECDARPSGYQAVNPPSTRNSWPVT